MARDSVCLLVLLLLLHPLCHSADAQSVEGGVVDDTRAPVAMVAVALIDDDGTLVAHSRTDAKGRFRVQAPAQGRYRVHVTRLGYRSLWGGPYDLVQDVALEVFVVIHPFPVPLEGIEVEVEGRVPRLTSVGFYDRQARAFGHFFEGNEVRRSGHPIARFLARLPRVRAGTRASLFGPGSVRNPALYVERGGVPCVPALWVDGSLVRSGGSQAEAVRPDDWLGTGDVAGLEFYTGPSSVPIEFSHSAACAVLVIWTRDARG